MIGNNQLTIKRIVSLSDIDKQAFDIFWISDGNIKELKNVNQGIVICSDKVDRSLVKSTCTYLLVESPRLYFLKLVSTFFAEKEAPSISDRSVIHPSVRIGIGCSIASGVVIEKNSIIGDDVEIGANTVIKAKTLIGNRVKIGTNNTIGGVGFGYERNEQDQYDLIPPIGNVVLEEDVEIGNNTTIDRAVLGSTILKKNVKVDNLVHIAHGVVIGENSLVIANAMIAGKVMVGNPAKELTK